MLIPDQLWIWLSCLVVAVLLYFRHVYGFFQRRGVKTPRIIPPFGTTLSVMAQQEHFAEQMTRAYKQFPDQRFYGAFQFVKPFMQARDIELIKKIGVEDFEHFHDHNNLVDEEHDPLFGRNIFALKGQEWRDMRSTLSPAFTGSKVKMMLPLIVEVGNQMILSLKKKIKESKQPSLEIDVKDLTTRYTNDVIASCAFGLKVDSHTDENNKFYAMGKTISTFTIRQLLKFLTQSSFPKVAAIFKMTLFPESVQNFYRTLVMEAIQDREHKKIVRPDLIHLLKQAKEGKLTLEEKSSNEKDTGFATVEESSFGLKEINRVWSDDDLVAQAILFFVAGFETVSSAMSFLFYELALNPDVQEKLYREIRDNKAKNNGKFDYNSVKSMVYMDMVISEILRLWPPSFSLDRYCTKDYNMGKPNDQATKDFIIRKGDGLQIPTFAIHRDSKYYPNPDKFDPERFSEENKHKIQPFTYMPFGLGPRNCIGSRFALCELKVITYQLLNNFEVSPSKRTPIRPKLDPSSFNILLKGGHWTQLRTRNEV